MIKDNNNVIGIRRLNEDIKYKIRELCNNSSDFLIIGSYNFWLDKDIYNIISTKNCVKVAIIPKNSFKDSINGERIIISLIKNNFAIVINNNNHSKFIVTDNQTYFGSLNMSYSSMMYNNEGILIYDNLSNNKLFKNEDVLTKDLVKYTLESLLTYKRNEILGKNQSEEYLYKLEVKLQDVFKNMHDYINMGAFKENALQFCTELSFMIYSYKDKIDDCYYNYVSQKIGVLIKKIEDIKFSSINFNKEDIEKYIEEVMISVKMENYKLLESEISDQLIEKNNNLVEKAIEYISKYFKGDTSLDVNLCNICGKISDSGGICSHCEKYEFEDPYYNYPENNEEIVIRDMLKELQSDLVSEFEGDSRINYINEYFIPHSYNIYPKEKFNLLTIETRNGIIDIKYDLLFISEYISIYIQFNGNEEEYFMKYKEGYVKYDDEGGVDYESEEEKEIPIDDIVNYINSVI